MGYSMFADSHTEFHDLYHAWDEYRRLFLS
jgi:hypothetical protein